MRKRIFAAVFVLTMLLCSCTKGESTENSSDTTSLSETAQTEAAQISDEYDYSKMFNYILLPDGVVIKRYLGSEKLVIIPSKIEELPIVEIASNAFKGTDAEEIVFPEGITEIIAPKGAEKLRKIVIPSSAEKIDVSELSYINTIESIEVMEGGSFAVSDGFLFTSDMKTLVYAFNCGEEPIVPSGTEHIGEYAFRQSGIRSVTLPETLKTIGARAFSDCKRLLCAEIPFSVKEIGSYAFCNSGLISVRLNNGLEKIGAQAFRYTDIAEIELPVTVADIGEYCFNDDCAVYAYFPSEALEGYNTTYLGETREQMAARLLEDEYAFELALAPDEKPRRIFWDMNGDGVPECFDILKEKETVCIGTFGRDNCWRVLGWYGDKLYHYSDKETGSDFFVADAVSETINYIGFDRLTPLADDIAADEIGWFSRAGTVDSCRINGKYYLSEAEGKDIDTDKYILDSMKEYELIEVINLNGTVIQNISQPRTMTYDEYEKAFYIDCIDIQGRKIHKDTPSLSIGSEIDLSILSELKKLVVLNLYGELENAELIKNYDNIKELFIDGIKDPTALAEMDSVEFLIIDNADSYDFLSGMDGVKVLEIWNTLGEPDDFFKVIKDMKSLQYLLVDNYNDVCITEGQQKWLRENLPELEVVYLWG